MADQRVEIVDYDPRWPGLFGEQRSAMEELLGPWLAGPIVRIGSTAVDGPAKPAIAVSGGSLSGAQSAVPVLADEGWLFWPENP